MLIADSDEHEPVLQIHAARESQRFATENFACHNSLMVFFSNFSCLFCLFFRITMQTQKPYFTTYYKKQRKQ